MRLRARFDARLAAAAALAALVPLGAATAVDLGLLARARARADAAEARELAARVHAERAALDAAQTLLRRDADVLALELARALPPDAPAADLDAALQRALAAQPALADAQVVTRGGTIVAGALRPGRAPAACPPLVVARPLAAPHDARRLVATYAQDCARHAAHARARAALAAHAGRGSAASAATRDRARGLALGALALAVGAVAAVAAWVARSLARRVHLLAIATARVREGDLAVRVRPRGDDEVDALIRAFNLMVEEMALSRSRIEYLQRIAAWQDFARRLAHEIKNPLTPIQLAVQEVARKYSGDDARFKRTLETAREVVEEEVDTLRRLVSAFSDFAKLPEVHAQPGDLAEFVRDMASSQAFLEEAAGGAERAARVRVTYDAGDRPLPVSLDRMLLRRALENLVRNAVQAVQGAAKADQAPAGNVWVRAARHDDQAWLVVEDDGPGIPPERAARVFDPYYTTKPEGTGLGLAIVRKIALDHQGDVGFEPREGGGARFVVTLPLRDPSRKPRLSFVTFSRRSPEGGPEGAPEPAPGSPPEAIPTKPG